MSVKRDPCLQTSGEVLWGIREFLENRGCRWHEHGEEVIETELERVGELNNIGLLVVVHSNVVDPTEATFSFFYRVRDPRRLTEAVRERFARDAEGFSETLMRGGGAHRFRLLEVEIQKREREVEVCYYKEPCPHSTDRYICERDRHRLMESLISVFGGYGFEPRRWHDVEGNTIEVAGFFFWIEDQKDADPHRGEGRFREPDSGQDVVEINCLYNGVSVAVNGEVELIEPPVDVERVVDFVKGYTRLILKRDVL